jgi:hypothetical protein
MLLEIVTAGVEFVVSREPLPKNDNEGRQKADRETGELLFTTELVAMDDAGAEVIKVTTPGVPPVVKRQPVAVRRLVANPWNVDGRGGVAYRALSITPLTTPPDGTTATPAAAPGTVAGSGAGSTGSVGSVSRGAAGSVPRSGAAGGGV